MRGSFPYESNGPLLSRLIVPDPVPRTDWETACAAWEASDKTITLLEWLITRKVVCEADLLEALSTAAGTGITLPGPAKAPTFKPPGARLLERHGFHFLGATGGQYLIAGGPQLPPDLGRYLGDDKKNWKWVLAHPLRVDESKESPPDAKIEAAGRYGLQDWLEELIHGLCARGAMDIHFERYGDTLHVRYHAIGGMQLAGNWTGLRSRTALRLLKTWAGMKDAPGGPPQDGRIALREGSGTSTLRISHLETVNGESAVLRVLRSSGTVLPLRDLGVPGDLSGKLLDTVLHQPGLILCSGPTGSGKTTTLYGLLHDLKPFNLKILTIEDPVESELPHSVQCQVDEAMGWTFEGAVRSFLRQDPDVILVGEIRDAASAKAACQAALTGHSVLSTIHAGSEEAAWKRMLAWGVGTGLLAETLRVVVNQRLHLGKDSPPRAAFTWFIPDKVTFYQRLGESPAPKGWEASNGAGSGPVIAQGQSEVSGGISVTDLRH